MSESEVTPIHQTRAIVGGPDCSHANVLLSAHVAANGDTKRIPLACRDCAKTWPSLDELHAEAALQGPEAPDIRVHPPGTRFTPNTAKVRGSMPVHRPEAIGYASQVDAELRGLIDDTRMEIGRLYEDVSATRRNNATDRMDELQQIWDLKVQLSSGIENILVLIESRTLRGRLRRFWAWLKGLVSRGNRGWDEANPVVEVDWAAAERGVVTAIAGEPLRVNDPVTIGPDGLARLADSDLGAITKIVGQDLAKIRTDAIASGEDWESVRDYLAAYEVYDGTDPDDGPMSVKHVATVYGLNLDTVAKAVHDAADPRGPLQAYLSGHFSSDTLEELAEDFIVWREQRPFYEGSEQ